MRLSAGPGSVEAPGGLLELAGPRTRLRTFVGSTAPLALTVERVASPLAAPTALNSPFSPSGDVELRGDTLLAHIPDNVYAAEAVLRTAWQIVSHRAGGVLMHGCAFHWKGSAVAAIGASGDGKSTLSRLSRGHPAHAKLLTDEIVWFAPDGLVHGTPFRSDEDNESSPGPATLKALLVLAKGPSERLDPLPATEALPLLLAQLYMPVVQVVPRAELVRRVMQLVERVPVQRLTFRKDPSVGTFLKEQL